MPCGDYRAIWRTNRTEIALLLLARDDLQALQVVAISAIRYLAPRSQGEVVPRLSANRKLSVVCSRKLPKDESHPACAISSDKSNAAPS